MAPARPQSRVKPLWRCPKCGKTFITRNIWHSCMRYDLEALFARSSPNVLRVYKHFARMVRKCGPITINVQKTGISFQVRVRAIGCVPRKDHLRIGFAFSRPRAHPRFVKVESFTPTFHAHWIRVHAEEELDAEVAGWVRDAYQRAAQRHRREELP